MFSLALYQTGTSLAAASPQIDISQKMSMWLSVGEAPARRTLWQLLHAAQWQHMRSVQPALLGTNAVLLAGVWPGQGGWSLALPASTSR